MLPFTIEDVAAATAQKAAARAVPTGPPAGVDGLGGGHAGSRLAERTGGVASGPAPIGEVVARPASAEGLSGSGVAAGHSLSTTPPAVVEYEKLSTDGGGVPRPNPNYAQAAPSAVAEG